MLHAARRLLTPGALALPLVIDDLDDIDNVYGAYSTKLIRAAYAGDLVRLRRVSDNVEDDFGPDGSGWLDGAAITTWLGGSSARVTTAYDQSGNGRNFVQTTAGNQPLLDLSASYPRLHFTRASVECLNGSAAAGFARNASALTMIHVGINDVSATDDQYNFWTSGGGSATSLRATLGVGHTDNFHVLSSRAIDGGSAAFGANIAAGTTTWVTKQGRIEFGAGARRHRVNSTSSDSTFTANNTSDTDSLSVTWGARNNADQSSDMKATTLILVKDALSNAEMDAMASFCEGLKAA